MKKYTQLTLAIVLGLSGLCVGCSAEKTPPRADGSSYDQRHSYPADPANPNHNMDDDSMRNNPTPNRPGNP